MTPEQKDRKRIKSRDYMRAKRLADPEYGRAWARNNPEKAKAATKRYNLAHPELYRAAWRRRKGVKNPSGELRHGSCEICGVICQLHYDHDHRTGEFRGWICGQCNRGLGCFKDSPIALDNAARYLGKLANCVCDYRRTDHGSV